MINIISKLPSYFLIYLLINKKPLGKLIGAIVFFIISLLVIGFLNYLHEKNLPEVPITEGPYAGCSGIILLLALIFLIEAIISFAGC